MEAPQLGLRVPNCPFTWKRKSLLSGIDQGAADTSCTISGNQCWFCQSRATRKTKRLSSLIRQMTWGSRATRGKHTSVSWATHGIVHTSPVRRILGSESSLLNLRLSEDTPDHLNHLGVGSSFPWRYSVLGQHVRPLVQSARHLHHLHRMEVVQLTCALFKKQRFTQSVSN